MKNGDDLYRKYSDYPQKTRMSYSPRDIVPYSIKRLQELIQKCRLHGPNDSFVMYLQPKLKILLTLYLQENWILWSYASNWDHKKKTWNSLILLFQASKEITCSFPLSLNHSTITFVSPTIWRSLGFILLPKKKTILRLSSSYFLLEPTPTPIFKRYKSKEDK